MLKEELEVTLQPEISQELLTARDAIFSKCNRSDAYASLSMVQLEIAVAFVVEEHLPLLHETVVT